MCYYAEYSSICVIGCGHKFRRTPKIGEPWNSTVLGWEVRLTPRYMPFPTCVTNKFGSSAIKDIRINRKEPSPKWGALRHRPLRFGSSLTPRNKLLSTFVILPNLVVLGQTVRALLRRSAWKFDPSCPAFEGHSGSSEPTQIDPPHMTSY